MHRRLRQVCTSLKEHGRVSFAKIASAGGFSDMNLILIKATSPDDLPLHDKYIYTLLKIFSLSPSSFHSFSLAFTRRFGTTRSWRVALKCLLLLHRLLRSAPADSPFRSELLWSRSNGLLPLHPCRFRDNTSSFSTESTVFIRSYALLLDEALDCVFLDGKELESQDEGIPETFQEKMKEIREMLEILPQIQGLIDRVIACVPIGVLAQTSVIVRFAMKLIIWESFVCYTKFRTDMAVVLDNLLQMPYKNCEAAFAIYKKAASQTSQLCQFYDWCKAEGLICGGLCDQFPLVDRIPQLQIQALETFLRGMWELTEESSSSTTSSSTSPPLSLTPAVSPGEKQVVRRDDGTVLVVRGEDIEKEKPLIELDDEDSWETLLESSISFSHSSYYGRSDLCCFSDGFNRKGHGHEDVVYNPFSQPNDMSFNLYKYY